MQCFCSLCLPSHPMCQSWVSTCCTVLSCVAFRISDPKLAHFHLQTRGVGTVWSRQDALQRWPSLILLAATKRDACDSVLHMRWDGSSRLEFVPTKQTMHFPPITLPTSKPSLTYVLYSTSLTMKTLPISQTPNVTPHYNSVVNSIVQYGTVTLPGCMALLVHVTV